MNEIARRSAIMVACVAVAMLTALPAAAQEPDESDFEDWQRNELRGLLEAINAAVAGQIVPDADPFEMVPDYLKGTDGNAYVPFTLTIDAAKVNTPTIAMYVHVAEAPGGSTTTAGAAGDSTVATLSPEPAQAVFEDAYFAEVTSGGSDPIHISRAFAAPGGVYDVYVALRESAGGESDQLPVAPIMMLRERLEVPDLWDGRLQTSSVIVPEVVEPLDVPLTPEEQILSPYSLGTTRIVPKLDRDFGKQDELSLIFLIYNPSVAGGSKPDLTVEYRFHQQTADGEEYFNKTNPQEFNARTLPPDFDVALGHQLAGGQTVPLALFPVGGYRLEIVLTDMSRLVAGLDEEAATLVSRSFRLIAGLEVEDATEDESVPDDIRDGLDEESASVVTGNLEAAVVAVNVPFAVHETAQ